MHFTSWVFPGPPHAPGGRQRAVAHDLPTPHPMTTELHLVERTARGCCCRLFLSRPPASQFLPIQADDEPLPASRRSTSAPPRGTARSPPWSATRRPAHAVIAPARQAPAIPGARSATPRRSRTRCRTTTRGCLGPRRLRDTITLPDRTLLFENHVEIRSDRTASTTRAQAPAEGGGLVRSGASRPYPARPPVARPPAPPGSRYNRPGSSACPS